MAYRDAVKYIEDMKPDYVRAVGDECLRTKGIINTALPRSTRCPARWSGALTPPTSTSSG